MQTWERLTAGQQAALLGIYTRHRAGGCQGVLFAFVGSVAADPWRLTAVMDDLDRQGHHDLDPIATVTALVTADLVAVVTADDQRIDVRLTPIGYATAAAVAARTRGSEPVVQSVVTVIDAERGRREAVRGALQSPALASDRRLAVEEDNPRDIACATCGHSWRSHYVEIGEGEGSGCIATSPPGWSRQAQSAGLPRKPLLAGHGGRCLCPGYGRGEIPEVYRGLVTLPTRDDGQTCRCGHPVAVHSVEISCLFCDCDPHDHL